MFFLSSSQLPLLSNDTLLFQVNTVPKIKSSLFVPDVTIAKVLLKLHRQINDKFHCFVLTWAMRALSLDASN